MRDVMDGSHGGKPVKAKRAKGDGMSLRDAAGLINTLFDEVEYHHDNVLPPPKPTSQQKEALRRVWEEVKSTEKK